MSLIEDYVYLIEIRGVYDGWSIGITPDGEYVNRWDKDDYRYAATQEVIERYIREERSK
jgi:hypothetical protein